MEFVVTTAGSCPARASGRTVHGVRRTTVYLPAALKARLEARAAEDAESQSAIVRRALERVLDEPPRSPRLPLDDVATDEDGRASPEA